MTPQELKNSILQLAIQGKLVEQRPEEGTAEELLEKIFAAKNAKDAKKNLTRRRRARGEKAAFASSVSPRDRISDDEKPFDIPESWEWVRIGEVFNLQAGKNIKSDEIHQEYSPKHRYKCYGGNGCRGYVADYNRKGHYVLIGRQGALCGNINYAEGDFYATEHAVVVEQFAGTDVYWCGYFLDALSLNRYATATAQPGLAVVKINQVLIPLPPLAEQKRIVAKIEELLPLIDHYEKAWSRLEDFNKRFPVDMQKSLLQMAIQGKLVEQRPEEGTGEELLREILAAKGGTRSRASALMTGGTGATSGTGARPSRPSRPAARPAGPASPASPTPVSPEEQPFDIPESWEWVRLRELLLSQPSNGMSPHGVAYQTPYKNLTLTATTSGYFRPEAFKYVEVSSELAEKYYLHDEDILIQRANSRELVGTSCIYRHGNQKFIYPDLMMRLHLLDGISVDFVDFVLKSPPCRAYFQATASGTSESMPKINQSIVRNTLIPLPPLAEQKRIVAKLEAILPLCERLKLNSERS